MSGSQLTTHNDVTSIDATSGHVGAALRELRAAVRGEVDWSRGTRARYSTDASNYRVLPAAVVFPRGEADVLATLDACRRHHVPLTSRGGGTSCAGNAIGPGIVLEFSRHMNRVVRLDPAARTAQVEPGCVEATLQRAAGEFGLRFGPDPSSKDRCTIGGMVGNNACGPHATAWGRTADNVVALDCVDGRGRRFTAGRQGGLDAVPGLRALIEANLAPIRTELGRFGRQVSGYSLEHLLPEGPGNLAAALTGTEGTLVTVLSVTVRLVDVPTAPVLVALGYPDMIAAAADVPSLLRFHPLALEGMDSRLVDVVRAHKGPGAVPDLPAGSGWLLAEIGGADADASMAAARALSDAARTDAVAVYPPGSQADALWRIRADGAGLGGRTPARPDGTGDEQAWPGFEDAAVPPANLADYLRDFTALMRETGVDGLLYGHFGDGCVHVRLGLPLETSQGVAHSRDFLVRAARLCAKHGGSVSGEHGDGRARSELLSAMYSPAVLRLFDQVKGLFDPDNLLNPGVLASPATPAGPRAGVAPLDQDLRRPLARRIPPAGGFAFRSDHGDFTTALHRCTGVGKCRSLTSGAFMCPSYVATRDEKDVTRGRARILEEAANGRFVHGFDSPEVRDALDLCLACKACSTDCPAGVDMAKYRSEVLFRVYRHRLRPRTHYTLGRLPLYTRLAASVPGAAAIADAVMGIAPVRRALFRLLGLDPRRPMPRLHSGTFDRWAASHGLRARPATGAGGASADPSWTADAQGGRGPRRPVVLWADSFSQTLEDAGARAAVTVLQRNGFDVLVPPHACCGLTWITTGQLTTAKKRLGHLLDVLGPYAERGIPIVGVEPSCTAVLRDDLLDLLPGDRRARVVSQATRTLAEILATVPRDRRDLPDLHGVQIVAQPHCHHYSVMGWGADAALLRGLGAQVVELRGCCGLAGNFGMERGHYDVSVAVARHQLLPALEAHPDAVYLADGFSCRTQARQLAGRDGIHLAQLLAGQATPDRTAPAGAGAR